MTWTILSRAQVRGNAVAAEHSELNVRANGDDRDLTFRPAGGGEAVTLHNAAQNEGRRYARQRDADGFQSKVVEATYGGVDYAMVFLGKKGDHAGDDDTEVFVATSGGGDQDPDG